MKNVAHNISRHKIHLPIGILNRYSNEVLEEKITELFT